MKLNTAFLSSVSYSFHSGQSKQNLLQVLCHFPSLLKIFNFFTIPCWLELGGESALPACSCQAAMNACFTLRCSLSAGFGSDISWWDKLSLVTLMMFSL